MGSLQESFVVREVLQVMGESNVQHCVWHSQVDFLPQCLPGRPCEDVECPELR